MPVLSVSHEIALPLENTVQRLKLLYAEAGVVLVSDDQWTLPEGQASKAPTTLWTAPNHGVSQSPQPTPFKVAVLILLGASPKPVDVEVASTRNGATTVDRRVHRLDSSARMLLIGSAIDGGHAVAGDATDLFATMTTPNTPSRVTRLRARNPNAAGATAGANNQDIRLLILG